MKKNRNKSIALALLAMAFLYGCDNNDYPVPEPSSQANFSYTINLVDVETESGTVSAFEVQFENQSVLASSYSWYVGLVTPPDTTEVFTSEEENPTAILFDEGNYVVSLNITSDNDYYYNKLTETKSIRLLLKETLFIETFDGEGPATEDTWLPDDWLAVDSDGDGLNWYWSPGEGDGQMRSQSWDGVDPLDVDNWLITAEIDLTEFADEQVILAFNVRPTANSEDYRQEHYGIFISTSGSAIADFDEEPLFTEKLTPEMPNTSYQYREVDVSAYAGQAVRFAIRHYESSDNDRIVFDNVEVYKKI